MDIASDGKSIVFGTAWYLHVLDATGKQKWKTSTQSTAWAVNIAGNDKIVAAALGDGTVRWYRMSDGVHLLTLYIHPDRKRWVLWTPSGYYTAAAGAEELLGWHVNQGEDKEGLYYSVSKFRETYYRPDVVQRILETLDETEALRIANEANNRAARSAVRNITQELPPTVRILSPMNGAEVRSNTVTLDYSIQSPNQEAITGIKLQINGRPVSTDRGLKPAGKRQQMTVQIPSDNCSISLIAENRFGSSEPASIDLIWQGQIEMKLLRPNLYILAVGVGDYQNDNYDLDFPDEDATAFVETLQKQEGLLYNRVVAKVFNNRSATRANILDGLDWLRQQTTQYDVSMIFFAGHGIEDNWGTFYFMPSDADENRMRSSCIIKGNFIETVSTIPGKVVVFMDACHSGGLMLASTRRNHFSGNPDINRIVNELIAAENGAVVFSSSTGRQSSLENPLWGHGAFTKALIEGLSGKAKYREEKGITCEMLSVYISRRVKQLTGGQQSPTTNFPPNVEDFPIAIIR